MAGVDGAWFIQTHPDPNSNRLSLKVPPTHRPTGRATGRNHHRLLTNDPRAAPPAPTQRPSTPDPVFVVIN